MNVIKKGLQFLLYSNILIGLCAVALALTNRLTVEGVLLADRSYGFVFFSTVFTYSLLKFRHTTPTATHTTHFQWAQQYPQLAKNIQLISLIAAAAFFFMLDRNSMIIVVIMAVLTALYALVDIPWLQPTRRLRDYGLLKTPLVALVWSVTTVVIPLADLPVDTSLMVFLLLRRFLFILSLTIVFEIKDLLHDREHNLQTLPMRLGVTNTKLLAQALLLGLMGLNTVQYLFFDLSLTNLLAINLSLLVSVLCIQAVKEETGDYWYYAVLDGLMILQFIFVYLAVTLFP